MEQLVEKLLVLAGKRKKRERKYDTEVENVFDELQEHMRERTDYTKNDRALRLLDRIKHSLQNEGYGFLNKNERGSPASNTTVPHSHRPGKNSTKHLVCGHEGVCVLLKNKPPKNMRPNLVVELSRLLGNKKQCYEFDFAPADKKKVRKTGVNTCIPKPATWHKLQKHGLRMDKVFDENGKKLLEVFTIDGIDAYTPDRMVFYTSNSGKCRRWLDGLDRMLDQY